MVGRFKYWWDYIRWNYPEQLFVLGLLVLVALGVGGYFTVSALGNGGTYADSVEITKQVKVTTTKLVPVVHTIRGRRVIRYKLQRIVSTQTHVESVPVYRKSTVLVHGKPVVVVKRINHTNTSTVVKNHTTPGKTQTSTHTVVGPGQTQVVTITGPGKTQIITTTITQTETAIVTETETDIVTTTITLPNTTT